MNSMNEEVLDLADFIDTIINSSEFRTFSFSSNPTIKRMQISLITTISSPYGFVIDQDIDFVKNHYDRFGRFMIDPHFYEERYLIFLP